MRCARSVPGSTSSRRSSASIDELEGLGVSTNVRVGINTGLVVVGDIGTGEFRDEMAVVGETPNIAARLQALAEPGTVVVGERTRRLLEGLFVFEERGPYTVKGHRRADRGLPRARGDRRAGSLRGDRQARPDAAGRPRRGDPAAAVALGGRQGAAKATWSCSPASPGSASRASCRRSASTCAVDQAAVLRYYCSPFYVHSALHPVLDQLERAADLKKTDSPEVKLDKLEALLSQGCRRGHPRRRRCWRRCCRSRPASRYPPLEVAPERKKALMLEALLEQLAGLATRPLLILLEDAHWIDPDLDRAVPADHRAHPAPAGPGDHRLPAELRAALDRLSARHARCRSAHLSHRQAAATGRQGDPRPPAAARGPRPHRQAHRRRPALRRGADQDAARDPARSSRSATASG